MAGPKARATLVALGLDALKHLRLLANLKAGEDRDRLTFQAREIEGALDRVSCPRAAECPPPAPS